MIVRKCVQDCVNFILNVIRRNWGYFV